MTGSSIVGAVLEIHPNNPSQLEEQAGNSVTAQATSQTSPRRDRASLRMTTGAARQHVSRNEGSSRPHCRSLVVVDPQVDFLTTNAATWKSTPTTR